MFFFRLFVFCAEKQYIQVFPVWGTEFGGGVEVDEWRMKYEHLHTSSYIHVVFIVYCLFIASSFITAWENFIAS